MSAWIALGLVVVAGLFLVLVERPGETLGVGDAELASLVAGVALLIWIGGAAIHAYRGRGSLALRQAVVWLAVALALVVIYTYRAEFEAAGRRVAVELLPGTPIAIESETQQSGREGGRRVVAVAARQGGEFSVEALVNGTHVGMLADTGATLVTLSADDAQRVGIDLGELSFAIPVSTANGRTLAARIQLDEVAVGGIVVRNVAALVARPRDLETSLLGMSFLGRIGSFSVAGNQLILRE